MCYETTVFSCTCFHLSIQSSWSIKHQTLNLQELIWFVSSYHGEAKPTPTLLQLGVNECPLQFCRVPCEKWLPSCSEKSIALFVSYGNM